jgi:hypothetical protein
MDLRFNTSLAEGYKSGSQIAARYGMTTKYKEARRHNLRPLQALEDWDLIHENDRELFRD